MNTSSTIEDTPPIETIGRENASLSPFEFHLEQFLFAFAPYEILLDCDFTTLKHHPIKTIPAPSQVWSLEYLNRTIYIFLYAPPCADHFAAVHILAQQTAIWQHLIKTKSITTTDALPPILPFMLFPGAKPGDTALSIHELLGSVPKSLQGFQPSLQSPPIAVTQPEEEDRKKIRAFRLLQSMEDWFQHIRVEKGFPSKESPFTKELAKTRAYFETKSNKVPSRRNNSAIKRKTTSKNKSPPT